MFSLSPKVSEIILLSYFPELTEIPGFGSHFQGLITEVMREVWPELPGQSKEPVLILTTTLSRAIFSQKKESLTQTLDFWIHLWIGVFSSMSIFLLISEYRCLCRS